MIEPALSLEECIERCKGRGINAMCRSVDFDHANLPTSAQDARQEAVLYDSIALHLQKLIGGRREHSRNNTTTSWNSSADSFGEE